MFEDKIEREGLEKMPAEYKELLERVLTIQADCEIGGPHLYVCLLYTSPSPRDRQKSRMPSSA